MKTGKYTKKDVCAVIVSFNPDNIIVKNVNALTPQVDRCIVIDNGSTEVKYLQEVEHLENIIVKYLEKNTGIAHALNEGLDYCDANHYPLILTMDQDTVLNADCVEALLIAMEKYKSQSVGINWDDKLENDKQVDYLITSGNLVNVDAAKSIGGYDEKLFIDSVDFDISLRLKDAGYQIIKVKNAGAQHSLGEKQGGSNYTTHSVQRYYYIFRNHFYLIKKYRKKHRGFCLKKKMAMGYDLVKILFFDKQRKEKYQMLVKGWKDSRHLM